MSATVGSDDSASATDANSAPLTDSQPTATATATDPGPPTGPDTTRPARSLRPGKRGIALLAVLALAAAGLGVYATVRSDGPDDLPDPQAVPSAAVTYEVSGTGVAEISYRGDGTDDQAVVIRDVELPWETTVQVPLGERPVVQITLGAEGGNASCRLTVRDQHIQHTVASGEYGRGTCSTELPPEEAAVGGY